MRVLIITKDLESNSTGRAYVLWLLAQRLGWTARVASPTGAHVWLPVATEAFVDASERVDVGDDDRWKQLVEDADLLIAVKPHENSFGLARSLSRRYSKPLLLDIDDPDLEAQRDPFFKGMARAVLQPRRYWRRRMLTARVRKYPHMVSNPVLRDMYGGTLVPHARHDAGPGVTPTDETFSVVFVGTNRAHKGVDVLRAAVAQLAPRGATLVVTDDPPADAKPHERWVGVTSLEAGIDLVKNGDVVVIPSLPGHAYSEAQLPVKIMDAMLAARPVVVSDIPPLVWAVGDGGAVAVPGDVDSLVQRLSELFDPTRRERLGRAGRERALRLFTVEAVMEAFEKASLEAVGLAEA